mmetsp:Transcript_42673/g.117747  ORF Transcript_42673/g.117747 Transcript_42673/m.117747 type:complete len:224 (+) Transcript_42673:850-1521(+)
MSSCLRCVASLSSAFVSASWLSNSATLASSSLFLATRLAFSSASDCACRAAAARVPEPLGVGGPPFRCRLAPCPDSWRGSEEPPCTACVWLNLVSESSPFRLPQPQDLMGRLSAAERLVVELGDCIAEPGPSYGSKRSQNSWKSSVPLWSRSAARTTRSASDCGMFHCLHICSNSFLETRPSRFWSILRKAVRMEWNRSFTSIPSAVQPSASRLWPAPSPMVL